MKKELISLVKSFILGYGLAAIQWQVIAKAGWFVIASQMVLLLAVYYLLTRAEYMKDEDDYSEETPRQKKVFERWMRGEL